MHYLEILPEASVCSCEPIVRWFLMEYLSDYGLDITITHKDLSGEGVYGWCMRVDESEFEIEIHNDLSHDDYMKTLMHELYHVYQYRTNKSQCELCAATMETVLVDKYSKPM